MQKFGKPTRFSAATCVPRHTETGAGSARETESHERVKRDVLRPRMARRDRHARPRVRQLSVHAREEPPSDRESLSPADERAGSRDVIAASEDPVSGICGNASDAPFGIRDHRSGAETPVERACSDRAMDGQKIPTVGDLESRDLGLTVRQVDLVVEQLKLPAPAPAPQSEAGGEIRRLVEGPRFPVCPERQALFSGLIDRQRRRCAPRGAEKNFGPEAVLGTKREGNEEECRQRGAELAKSRADIALPPCATRRRRRSDLLPGRPAARRHDGAACTAAEATDRCAG